MGVCVDHYFCGFVALVVTGALLGIVAEEEEEEDSKDSIIPIICVG